MHSNVATVASESVPDLLSPITSWLMALSMTFWCSMGTPVGQQQLALHLQQWSVRFDVNDYRFATGQAIRQQLHLQALRNQQAGIQHRPPADWDHHQERVVAVASAHPRLEPLL